MLKVSGSPCATPTGEMLQENVGDAVEEDHERFSEFTRGDLGLPFTDNGTGRLHVPGPAQVGPAAKHTSQSQKTIPEKDTSFDKVRKTIEDLLASLQTRVSEYQRSGPY